MEEGTQLAGALAVPIGKGALAVTVKAALSPTGNQILFTSYDSGFPRIYLMDLGSMGVQALAQTEGNMTFAPRFAPDGRTVVFSLERGGNSDIYALDIGSGQIRQLTNARRSRRRRASAPTQPDRVRE